MAIDSRRGALQGPFVRWADVAEPRPGIVVQGVRIAEGWVYMMEPEQGYVVREQVHASEQVVQVVEGSLRLQVGADERLLTPDDIAVVPIGTYHRGLVTTPVHLRVLLAEASELPAADFLLCATAPLSPQLAIEAEARFAAPLHEIYGCTEAGQIATRRPTQTQEWRTLPGVSRMNNEWR